MKYWLGHGLVDSEAAKVSVLDHGFTVADGVFETLKVIPDRDGDMQPFAATRHLRRLSRSAEGLGLPDPDHGLIREAMTAVVEANARDLGRLARLRVTYTAGVAPLGSERGTSGTTLVVAAAPTKQWAPGPTAAVVPWPRNERSPIAGVKSTSYAENVVALAAAHRVGSTEALMANTRGELCEGTGSNVFGVREGRLLTPPLTSGCLAGITRELVIEWCRDEGMEVVETELPMSEVGGFSEMFLTSSTRDVHGLSGLVDSTTGETIASLEASGPVTSMAAAIWSRNEAEGIDP